VSRLLELLGRGLDRDLGDVLDRYFWPSQTTGDEDRPARDREQPGSHEALHRLGVDCLREQKIGPAIEALTRACRLNPQFPPSRIALAVAHAERNGGAEAMEHLKAASALLPDEAPIHFAVGLCGEKLGRPEEAARHYQRAIACDGSNRPARERLAAVGVRLDHIDQAIDQYVKIGQANPGDASLRSVLAHLYYRAGRFGQSIEVYASAIGIEPENWALADDEVEVMVAAGQIHQAIGRLEMLIEGQGPFADLHVRLADLHSQLGNDTQATEHYRTALAISPTYLEATVKLGTHHLVCGRWEPAADSFLQASDINDRLLDNYIGVGVAQMAAGQRAEAASTFDLAGAIEPNGTLLLTEMARLHLKARTIQAISAGGAGKVLASGHDLGHDQLLQRQIELHAEEVRRRPNHADLRYRYGLFLRAENRLHEAAENFLQAARICPGYVRAIIRLGITQRQLGLEDQADETFREAQHLPPALVEMHYKLGLLYTDRALFERTVQNLEAASGSADDEQIRMSLAVSLQNMGLMDSAAATWRGLARVAPL